MGFVQVVNTPAILRNHAKISVLLLNPIALVYICRYVFGGKYFEDRFLPWHERKENDETDCFVALGAVFSPQTQLQLHPQKIR